MAKNGEEPGAEALLASVRSAIADHRLLTPDDRILVGLSGGPDSVVLLHCLLRLGYAVGAAHLDHGWRPESAAEATEVASWCAAWGVPCALGRQEAEPGGTGSLEADARQARYAFLASVARARGYSAIAVGHHQGDQAETMLFRLARGTGVSGLAGMRPRRALPDGSPLVRPLLGVSRARIEAARSAWELPALADPSNLDLDRPRNRLRHVVLPALEAVNPAATRHLADLAERVAEEEALREESTRRLANLVSRMVAPGLGEVDRQSLLALPPADRRRLLRHLVGRLGSGAWDAAALDAALGLAEAGGEADLAGGWRVAVEGRHLVVRGPWAPPAPAALAGAGEQPTTPWGWRVRLSVGATAAPASSVLVRFDRGALPADLVWRTAEPDTDRFRPWGHQAEKTLRHFLARSHIPRHRHESLLVLASGTEVVWVVGVRRGGLAPVVRTPENLWE
ncbi:MAG: tRNA lysidine(34) synthetase TilS, partial [Candidatus Sericytochromatia bacterium]